MVAPLVPTLRLGELLLSRGTCTRDQLREAWEQKVLFGDRLGTNLLVLGHIDEAGLAVALGAQHGVHAGHGKVIKPEVSALKLVGKQLAQSRAVVPHHIHERSLFVLMRDPHDPLALDELRFVSGLKIVPVVVCEARVWQLIERHYGVRMSLRPVPLDGLVRTRAAPVPAARDSGEQVDLVSEDEFNRLYAGMHGAPVLDEVGPLEVPQPVALPSAPPPGAPAADPDDATPELFTPTNPARPSAKTPSVSFLAPPKSDHGLPDVADEEHGEWRDVIEKTNPMLALVRGSTESGPIARPLLAEPEPLPLIDLVEADEPTLSGLRRQATLDFHVDAQQVLQDAPLSFAEATEALKGASDRAAIARVVLRFARSTFARACLFTVYPDRVVGWQGLGDGTSTEKLREVVLSRADKSVFGLVADSRSHYLGPLARWPAHGQWVKQTGRQIPRSVAVFPILVRGRPVNLIYVDNGHDGFVSSDVGEVLILAQQIAATYETLLRSP